MTPGYTTVSIPKEVSELLTILSKRFGMSKSELIEKSVKEFNKKGKSKEESVSDELYEMWEETENFVSKNKIKVESFDITTLDLGDAYEEDYIN